MALDQQKEQFSNAYVQAVAACAGFAWSKPSVDDDSVDMTLHQTGGRGTVRSPKLELQTKCKATTTPPEGQFGYWVKLKNYDDLRDPTVQVPRVLVVVLVPDALNDWLDHAEPQMAMRRCGYWLSLRGLGDTASPTGQTVQMTRDQVFTVTQLQQIMARIGQGGLP